MTACRAHGILRGMLVGVRKDQQSRLGDQVNGIAVVIADPHPGTRRALRIALSQSETITVMGEAPDLVTAITAASGVGVDVVLADSRIAGLASETARAGLAQLSRQVAVIVMGMGEPRLYAAPLQAAGAASYWPKDGDLEQLTKQLMKAAHARPRAATHSTTRQSL